MEFGLDSYAVFHAKKGKVQDPGNGLDFMSDTINQVLLIVSGCG
jgi:hypothetical protein